MPNKTAQHVLVPGQMEIDAISGKVIGFRVVAPDDIGLRRGLSPEWGLSPESTENRDFYSQPSVEELIREQNYVHITLSEIFEKSSELFESEEDRQNFCHAVEEAKK